MLGQSTPLDQTRRVVIVVVNAASSPQRNWDASVDGPGSLDLLLSTTGVPINRNSRDTMELLDDIVRRWRLLRQVRASPAFSASADPALAAVINAPDIELYPIEVSFAAVADTEERRYLNSLPTNLALPETAVDRLRRAGATVILQSSEFQRLLQDTGTALVSPGVQR